jgi:Na+/glutamate symporter
LFSILFTVVYAVSGISVEFDLAARDLLLVYFFTTIGINASLKDLVAGGKPLMVLLAVTIAYMVLQNLTGISVAALFDLPAAVGVLGGTISLIGGHGTAIAWAPTVAQHYGVADAMEIGIACATFGLILASLMGGPIAKFLIDRNNLAPERAPGLPGRCPGHSSQRHSRVAAERRDIRPGSQAAAVRDLLLRRHLVDLGSTATAMANMSAVTKRYGASHLAFIVVPLVCAFFIDLANALLIPFFLANF